MPEFRKLSDNEQDAIDRFILQHFGEKSAHHANFWRTFLSSEDKWLELVIFDVAAFTENKPLLQSLIDRYPHRYGMEAQKQDLEHAWNIGRRIKETVAVHAVNGLRNGVFHDAVLESLEAEIGEHKKASELIAFFHAGLKDLYVNVAKKASLYR